MSTFSRPNYLQEALDDPWRCWDEKPQHLTPRQGWATSEPPQLNAIAKPQPAQDHLSSTRMWAEYRPLTGISTDEVPPPPDEPPPSSSRVKRGLIKRRLECWNCGLNHLMSDCPSLATNLEGHDTVGATGARASGSKTAWNWPNQNPHGRCSPQRPRPADYLEGEQLRLLLMDPNFVLAQKAVYAAVNAADDSLAASAQEALQFCNHILTAMVNTKERLCGYLQTPSLEAFLKAWVEDSLEQIYDSMPDRSGLEVGFVVTAQRCLRVFEGICQRPAVLTYCLSEAEAQQGQDMPPNALLHSTVIAGLEKRQASFAQTTSCRSSERSISGYGSKGYPGKGGSKTKSKGKGKDPVETAARPETKSKGKGKDPMETTARRETKSKGKGKEKDRRQATGHEQLGSRNAQATRGATPQHAEPTIVSSELTRVPGLRPPVQQGSLLPAAHARAKKDSAETPETASAITAGTVEEDSVATAQSRCRTPTPPPTRHTDPEGCRTLTPPPMPRHPKVAIDAGKLVCRPTVPAVPCKAPPPQVPIVPTDFAPPASSKGHLQSNALPLPAEGMAAGQAAAPPPLSLPQETFPAISQKQSPPAARVKLLVKPPPPGFEAGFPRHTCSAPPGVGQFLQVDADVIGRADEEYHLATAAAAAEAAAPPPERSGGSDCLAQDESRPAGQLMASLALDDINDGVGDIAPCCPADAVALPLPWAPPACRTPDTEVVPLPPVADIAQSRPADAAPLTLPCAPPAEASEPPEGLCLQKGELQPRHSKNYNLRTGEKGIEAASKDDPPTGSAANLADVSILAEGEKSTTEMERPRRREDEISVVATACSVSELSLLATQPTTSAAMTKTTLSKSDLEKELSEAANAPISESDDDL